MWAQTASTAAALHPGLAVSYLIYAEKTLLSNTVLEDPLMCLFFTGFTVCMMNTSNESFHQELKLELVASSSKLNLLL